MPLILNLFKDTTAGLPLKCII
ncbi:MAG: hypothetical protein JWQ14_2138, partial [Adhaeribacter sp.]|nr:hypothetical protein [Adhaeribacter sp.]